MTVGFTCYAYKKPYHAPYLAFGVIIEPRECYSSARIFWINGSEDGAFPRNSVLLCKVHGKSVERGSRNVVLYQGKPVVVEHGKFVKVFDE